MTGSKKIKLLIITPSLECGGSEKYVSTLCDHLDTAKFEIRLAVLDNSKPFYTIQNTSVTVIDLNIKRVRHSLAAIQALVKADQPDIIFSVANHLNLYLAIYRKRFPKSIRFISRESSLVSVNSQRASLPFFYRLLLKRYYKRMDLVICQSAAMQADIISNYGIPAAKTGLIFNGVEATTGNVQEKSEAHKFITVSRLSPEKGIERLLRSVSLLSFPFTYHIIGEGTERIKLEALSAELGLTGKVIFEGQQTDPFKGNDDAELFLMGSFYEGLPNVLLEAGVRGIPVIAFNVPGGIPEIITDGKNGLLVKEDGVLSFAKAIEKALQMEFDRKRISRETHERFSLEKHIEEIGKLFRS